MFEFINNIPDKLVLAIWITVGLIIIISTMIKTKNNDARFFSVLAAIVWPFAITIFSPFIGMILFYKIVIFIIGSKEN